MDIASLKDTAAQMVAPGKGLIAADESAGTCEKRFSAVGVPCTEENRRAYRETIITAPGLEEHVSGIILFDETIRQKTTAGESFSQNLSKRGILPGIKVDGGVKDLALHPGEQVSEGLDKLRERLAEYYALGARFAKWRSVITIGKGIPSSACINANAHAMARYAALCQEAGIAPIVEPEVLIDGDHTIEQCFDASTKALKRTFEEMADQGVFLEGAILKASMVIAGKGAGKQSTPKEVAAATVRCLKESVPTNLAGVVFLSGGQGDEQATENLDEMNKLGQHPWPLSFSYSRAIQNPVLKLWAANPTANVAKAQEILLFRAKMNGLAAEGKYSSEMENGRPY